MELSSISGARFRSRAPSATGQPESLIAWPTPRDDLFEAIEAREVLETTLARLAALRRSPEDIERLDSALDQMRACQHDPAGFATRALGFQTALAAAAGNELLSAGLVPLRDVFVAVLTLADRGSGESLLAGYERLADAIEHGDVDRAPRLVSEMLETLRERASAVHVNQPSAERPTGAIKGDGQ